MGYKKLNISFKEKIVFLFTGLLDKKHLIGHKPNITFQQEEQEKKNDINNIEECTNDKIDIPFFELDSSKTKSNL